jgi:AI-2 transport protein TqsA
MPDVDSANDRTSDVPAPPLFGVLVLAGLVVTAAGLKSLADLVGPVFLVLTLVITVHPLTAWLVRHRLPQALASVAALASVYGLLIVVLGAVAWSLSQLVSALTDYSDEFTGLYSQALDALNNYGVSASNVTDALGSINLSTFAGLAQILVNQLTSGLSLLALMLATVFFLVINATDIDQRITLLRESRPNIADAFLDFAHSVRSYWVVTTIFGLIVAILDVSALTIIGVPLAFTWGVLAFVTNYIPNIGFLIGLIPPTMIALVDGGVGPAVALAVTYTLLNVIIQTFIQPRFTGSAVGITGTVAFLSLIFWAYLLGALGALLAIPATMFVKTLLVDHTRSGRWAGALINTTENVSNQIR